MSYYRRRRKPKQKPTKFASWEPYARHFYELSKTRAHYHWDLGSDLMITSLAGMRPSGERRVNDYKSVLITNQDRATFAGILTDHDYAVVLHERSHPTHRFVDCTKYGKTDYEQRVKSLDEEAWKSKYNENANAVVQIKRSIAESWQIAGWTVFPALFLLTVGLINKSWGDIAIALVPAGISLLALSNARNDKAGLRNAEEQLALQAKTTLPQRAFPDAPARSQPTIFELNRLQPKEFEQHVAQIYAKLGYSTRLTGHTDQGVDVIAERGGEKIAIQCKRYDGSVGNAAVQAVYAGASLYQCNRTMVITTSRFTAEAARLAKITGTQLVDGPAYQKLVRQSMVQNSRPFPKD